MDNKDLIEIAKNIKLVAFDVDGVMTDGSLSFTQDGVEIKTFNAKDGMGVVMLSRAGLVTSIITARDNNTVNLRAKMIDIKELYTGQKDKTKALEDLINKYNINKSQVAYMGDDLPDICILKQIALACCPKDAVSEVKKVCNFISKKKGGRGAVRELCDFILEAKGINYDMLLKPNKQ